MANEEIEVFIEMRARVPFRSGKRRRWIGRELVIEKTEAIGPNGKRTWVMDFDVNLEVNWQEGDTRDKSILNGQERLQNVIVDARKVLLILQGMYPELEITFKAENAQCLET